MISIGQLPSTLQHEVRALAQGDAFSIRTYKGDRGFSVLRTEQGYRFSEDGFIAQVLHFEEEKALLKHAKKATKREFPRSNKLHLVRQRKEA